MSQWVPTAPKAGADDAGGRGNVAVVRYQVAEIERSIGFYVEQLGFRLERRAGDAFAEVARGALHLLSSGPGSSGSRPLPDGRPQTSGGDNRILLYVEGIASRLAELRQAGVRVRNAVESGPGGKQVQIEDPDGNPIELHEA